MAAGTQRGALSTSFSGCGDPLRRKRQPAPVFSPGKTSGSEKPGRLSSRKWKRFRHGLVTESKTRLSQDPGASRSAPASPDCSRKMGRPVEKETAGPNFTQRKQESNLSREDRGFENGAKNRQSSQLGAAGLWGRVDVRAGPGHPVPVGRWQHQTRPGSSRDRLALAVPAVPRVRAPIAVLGQR